MKQWLINHWYRSFSWLAFLLSPLSGLYRFVSFLRHVTYRVGLKKTTAVTVPVIIVGNITVGGTGKTPLVIALIQQLQQWGYRVGCVSRGYSGKKNQTPQLVTVESDPNEVGDEPVIIVQHTQCPLVVARDRVAAAKQLLRQVVCDVIVSDDGLQHDALERSIEIVVVDQARGIGNGFCLPAGPLREPVKRLEQVDYVILSKRFSTNKNIPLKTTYYSMQFKSKAFIALKKTQKPLVVGKVHAFAGIGYPESFFQQLNILGFQVIEHRFPDHYQYVEKDFENTDDYPVVMTEKDAVKCRQFAKVHWYYLPIEVKLPESFFNTLKKQLLTHLTQCTKI